MASGGMHSRASSSSGRESGPMAVLLPDPRVGRFEGDREPGPTVRGRPRFEPVGVVSSVLEEHCQECAAPGCYATCPFHKSHDLVGCRRFVEGIRRDKSAADGAAGVWLRLSKLARVKVKARVVEEAVWRRGFFLQIWISHDVDRPIGGVLQISASPWTHDTRGYTRSFNAWSGWTELFVSPHDLSFLIGSAAVEASIFFPEFVGEIWVEHANFCDSVEPRGHETYRAMPKVLFCDLDGTVWSGAVGETVVELRPGVASVLRELRSKRIRIVGVTRTPLRHALDAVAAQGLDREFEEVVSVGRGEAKSSCITSWLAENGYGADESIFADDDGSERHEVMVGLPGTTVIDEHELCNAPVHPSIAGRTGRPAHGGSPPARCDPGSMGDLGAVVVFEAAGPADHPRCWELLMRTNRYNCVGWQPSYAEFIEAVGSEEVQVWTGTCFDDHEDFGLCCVAVVHGSHFRALTFSCRIGHRDFPHAFIGRVLAEMGRSGSRSSITWESEPRPRADSVVWVWRRGIEVNCAPGSDAVVSVLNPSPASTT